MSDPIQLYSDKEGDRIVGSYSEARDPDGKVVVRRVESRAEAATYRTPFAGAQLNIITHETFGRPNSDGVTPKYVTIQVIGMAASLTRDRCETWAVPADLVEEARGTAIAAVLRQQCSASHAGAEHRRHRKIGRAFFFLPFRKCCQLFQAFSLTPVPSPSSSSTSPRLRPCWPGKAQGGGVRRLSLTLPLRGRC